MSIPRKLAQFAAKFFALPTSDNKVYGIKNGDFFEVPSGGGTPTIAKADLIGLALDGSTLISSHNPVFFDKAVGFAVLPLYGRSRLAAPNQYGAPTGGNDSSASGTGAAIGFGLGALSCLSGTTATGKAAAIMQSPFVTAPSFYDVHEIVGDSARFPVYFGAACYHYLDALSDATNEFTAYINLIGRLTPATPEPAATTPGVTLKYTHTLNGGKYVILYRNASGTLTTINTTEAPPVGLGSSRLISVKLARLTSSTSTITVKIGSTEYIITDSSANSSLIYMVPGIGAAIVKTVGTTGRAVRLRSVVYAATL